MSNVHDLPCTPHVDTMYDVVQRIFANVDAGSQAMVEIAWTDARAPHALNAGELYELGQLEEAVDKAAQINAIPNCNVYFSAGLRSQGSYRHARASDVNVRQVVAVWADFDAAGAMSAAHAIAAQHDLAPNLVTFTGNDPHLRGQFWWILDEPTSDLALHRAIVSAIARHMGGDTSVINPSRVMRLIGSVAWPLKAGRVLEMTGMLEGGTRVAPYSMDEIAGKLERAGWLERPEAAPPRVTASGLIAAPGAQSNNVLDFSVAEPSYDLDGLIKRAAEPSQWHRHALLATAHLLGRGTPPDVVVELLTTRLQQPGYSYVDTRNELGVMVQGALRRGLYHEAPAIPLAPPAPVVERRENPFLTMRALLNQPRAEWMVEGYLPERGMSAIFAPPAAFKSFLALDLGLSVAYGVPWHGFATKQRRVLYICAEGQYSFGERILVWAAHRAGAAETDQFVVLPVPVNFLDPGCVAELMTAIDDHLGGVGLTIIDTLARNFGDGDENSTKDMNAYVHGSAKLVERGSHVMHVHHTGKDGGKGERGSSAFLGALDTSLRLEREQGSDVATLHVKKQKSGPEALPMRLAFPLAEAPHPVTGELIPSRIPTLAGGASIVVAAPPTGSGLSKMQRQMLTLIASGVCSTTVIALEIGCDKGNASRALKALKARGLVIQDENHFWRLTDNQTDNQKDEGDQDDDY